MARRSTMKSTTPLTRCQSQRQPLGEAETSLKTASAIKDARIGSEINGHFGDAIRGKCDSAHRAPASEVAALFEHTAFPGDAGDAHAQLTCRVIGNHGQPHRSRVLYRCGL